MMAQAMDKQMVSINQQSFYLEVPQTAKEYKQGLMYRHHMPAHQGMMFRFNPDNQPIMWMKNTYIPLDILFIGADHRIKCIVEQARPLSLKLVRCPVPVAAVIELNAGEVKKCHLLKGMNASW
jgi:uncharacterized membrane protein (UPF0127 family)